MVVKIEGKAPRRSVSEGIRKVVTLYQNEIYQSDLKAGAFLRALLKYIQQGPDSGSTVTLEETGLLSCTKKTVL